jgi:hypothetical protein
MLRHVYISVYFIIPQIKNKPCHGLKCHCFSPSAMCGREQFFLLANIGNGPDMRNTD